MKYFSLIVFTLFLCSSCNDEIEDNPADIEAGTLYRYFPLDSGSYIVYQVDSIIHRYEDDQYDNPDSLVDTFHYEVKEVVDSSFIDGEGDVAWRIARYYRGNNTEPWNFTTLWTAKRTSQSAQKVEENIRFIKLSFPIQTHTSWNGNLYNFLPEEDYSVDEANVPIDIGGFNFDSSVTVIELADSNALHKIFKKEKYAYRLGLVYRQRDSLNLTQLGNITNGVEFHQSLIDYSPR